MCHILCIKCEVEVCDGFWLKRANLSLFSLIRVLLGMWNCCDALRGLMPWLDMALRAKCSCMESYCLYFWRTGEVEGCSVVLFTMCVVSRRAYLCLCFVMLNVFLSLWVSTIEWSKIGTNGSKLGQWTNRGTQTVVYTIILEEEHEKNHIIVLTLSFVLYFGCLDAASWWHRVDWCCVLSCLLFSRSHVRMTYLVWARWQCCGIFLTLRPWRSVSVIFFDVTFHLSLCTNSLFFYLGVLSLSSAPLCLY